MDDLKKPSQLSNDAITGFKGLKTPKSIILIIADGAGIGQYTLSYYANDNFSPSRLDHVCLDATQPDS
jgi:alkaline phosphatase